MIKRVPGEARVSLPLLASGSEGARWWFLNGQPLTDTAPDASFNQAFNQLGRQQLSVLDESGQTARLEFSIAP